MVMFFLILALVFIVLLVIITNIVIVPQSKVYVVERLGSYSDTWSAGLHIKIPFIERIAKKVSLKEQVADFPPQPVITRDNVTMQIDTVVFFQVMDAKLYTYGVNQPIAAIESLSATTLRNIIGEMELDHTLTSRDVINGKITAILDEATDKWGIKVNRVEVKNIIPPREIQEAMEKQMKAEREKRAVILKADGYRANRPSHSIPAMLVPAVPTVVSVDSSVGLVGVSSARLTSNSSLPSRSVSSVMWLSWRWNRALSEVWGVTVLTVTTALSPSMRVRPAGRVVISRAMMYSMTVSRLSLTPR